MWFGEPTLLNFPAAFSAAMIPGTGPLQWT